MRPLDQIRPYEGNPRVHDNVLDALVASIQRFGFRQPLVLDRDGVIIIGHGRYKAAVRMGLREVPVHIARELTEAEARALRIADNQIASLSSWDLALLPVELKALEGLNFDLPLLAFDEEELARLLSGDVNPGLADPDAVPAPPDKAVTRPGDLWLLGDHRLLCGDSGKADDVDRLLDGNPVHLSHMDPPYNVRVEPRSNNAYVAGETTFHPVSQPEAETAKRKRSGAPPAKPRVKATTGKMRAKDRGLENDNVSDEEFSRLLDGWFGNIARVLKPGRAFYVWGGYANLANYPPALARHELYFSQGIVWDKQHPVLTRKDFMGAFELAFYGWRLGAAHKFFGPNNATDLWPVKKLPSQQMEHLTAKPAELAVRAIQYSSLKGENVLDLFGGSGSTLIAAEQTGRRAYVMEIDALYCDVIADRFQRFTGKKAVLKRTGKSPIPMKPREEAMR
jgi:DNA modification methylase